MTHGVRLYLVGSFVLVSLAGCGRGFFQSAEREPWRAEAEVACLKSGAVKESAELVRIDPISGPGVCGAEYPLKVAALGENITSFGFADESLRPPGNIGNQPRWPITRAPAAAPPQGNYQGNYQGSYPGATIRIRRRASRTMPRRRTVRSRCPRRASPRRRMTSICRPKPRRNRAAAAIWLRRPIRRASRYPAPSRSIFATVLFAATAGGGRAAARARAGQFRQRLRAGLDEARGDAGVPDRLGARPLAHQFRAAGGDALVRRARRRDQADLGLFLPRHERQSARAYFRARLRQRARHRGLHARRRPPHHGEGRLARHAGRAGLSARRAGGRLPAVQHRAGAGLQLPSRGSHPRRPDAPRPPAAPSASPPPCRATRSPRAPGSAIPMRSRDPYSTGSLGSKKSVSRWFRGNSKVNEEDEFEDH